MQNAGCWGALSQVRARPTAACGTRLTRYEHIGTGTLPSCQEAATNKHINRAKQQQSTSFCCRGARIISRSSRVSSTCRREVGKSVNY